MKKENLGTFPNSTKHSWLKKMKKINLFLVTLPRLWISILGWQTLKYLDPKNIHPVTEYLIYKVLWLVDNHKAKYANTTITLFKYIFNHRARIFLKKYNNRGLSALRVSFATILSMFCGKRRVRRSLWYRWWFSSAFYYVWMCIKEGVILFKFMENCALEA